MNTNDVVKQYCEEAQEDGEVVRQYKVLDLLRYPRGIKTAGTEYTPTEISIAYRVAYELSERGQAMVATVILLAIIIIGMYVILTGMDVTIPTISDMVDAGRDCYRVTYASGLTERICK